MESPDQKIRELQEIYAKEYGEEISYEKASELSQSLLQLFKTFKNQKS